MPLIARVMDRAGLDFAALDRIAVTTGPGSFTGLRVGIAAARGIALAAGKPAIGLTTLAAYAAPLVAADGTRSVVAAIDARHDQVYFQVFGPGGRTVVPPRVAPMREALRVSATGAPALVGTGAAMLAAAWPPGERPPSLDRCAPRSRHRMGGAARRRRDRDRRLRRSRSICVRPTRSRKPRRKWRGDDGPVHQSVRARRARAVGSRKPRRRGDRRAAWRLVRPRLERAGGRRPAHRPPRHRPSRHDRREHGRIHPVARGRGRGGNPLGRGRRQQTRARPRAQDAQSAFAPAGGAGRARRCSWRSTSTTPRRSGSTTAPDSAGSPAAPNYYPAVGGKRPPRWCCAAIWFNRPGSLC